jgi:hypothetical protein
MWWCHRKYVNNTVNSLIRPALHVDSLECIWLEIKLNNKTKTKYLFGTLYILPTSDLQTWRNIEHSIDQRLSTCRAGLIKLLTVLLTYLR